MLQKTILEEAYQIIEDEPIVQKYGITLDQFVWATCQRMSRAFNLPPRAGGARHAPINVHRCLAARTLQAVFHAQAELSWHQSWQPAAQLCPRSLEVTHCIHVLSGTQAPA